MKIYHNNYFRDICPTMRIGIAGPPGILNTYSCFQLIAEYYHVL